MKDDNKNQSNQIPDRTSPQANEISWDGIECSDEVNSVITRWIESPRVISVDEVRQSVGSVEDLLVLCAVLQPDDDALEDWQESYGLFDERDEWEGQPLPELTKKASRWLVSYPPAKDDDWVVVCFEFGGMASGAVFVVVNEFTQGIYTVTINHGWEGKHFPSVLGTVTTDNFVEKFVDLVASDPGIGVWWDGPSSAPWVEVGGRLPGDQRIAIEAVFNQNQEEYDE
jgi:hypothetical protein